MTNQNQNLNKNIKFQLCRQRKKIWLFSILLSLLSLTGLVASSISPSIGYPLRPGLEFTGGSQIILERDCTNSCSNLSSESVTNFLNNIPDIKSGNLAFPSLSGAKVQVLDNSKSILLRLPFLTANQSEIVVKGISNEFGPFLPSSISIDTIGPTLVKRLLRSSLFSLLASFVGIALYINFRYDKRFSFLALLALVHDELIVCGLFSWLGIINNVEVDSLFAVSLLTIAGYSVYNTVVVFDRIRERSRIDNNLELYDQIDNAVNATFTRTIYTSLTTLFPLLCILIWGGSSLYWFSIALSLGVIVGSWSSIALAPSLLSLSNAQKKS